MNSYLQNILFISFGFLFSLSICSNADLQANVSELILENLRKFDNNIPNDITWDLCNPEFTIGPDDKFSRIDWVLSKNIFEYIEFKSLSSFLETSKYFNYVAILFRLQVICPYFTFNESWMNRIMYSFLKANYYQCEGKLLSQSSAHDIHGNANINFILKTKVHKSLPTDILYVLFCFINELLYGLNTPLPNTQEQWENWYFKNLFYHYMPSCNKFYMGILQKIIESTGDMNLKHEMNSFIANSRSKRPINWLLETCGTLELHVETFRNAILQRNIIASEKAAWSVQDENPLKYLQTRDASNPFNFNVFISLSLNIYSEILNFISVLNPTIMQIKIFREIVRFGVLDLQPLLPAPESLLFNMFNRSLHIFLNILFEESPTPINLFVLVETGSSKCVQNIFQYHFLSLDNIQSTNLYNESVRIYIESIKHDNPLPLLFIDIETLNLFRDLIFKKFNFNKRYTFDCNLKNDVTCYEISLAALEDKTLTFKELVTFINNERLTDFFGPLINNNSIAPVPFSKFLNQGIIEAVASIPTSRVSNCNCLIC